MNSSFKSPQRLGDIKPLQTWDVGDDEQEKFQVHPGERRELSPREVEELRRLKKQGPEQRIDDYSKKRLEILANIGRMTKVVDFDGISFSLRTLKTKESQEAVSAMLGAKNDLDARFELRRHSLARSIYEIDKQPIVSALGSTDLASSLEMIDEMDENVIESLYHKFQELNKEASSRYNLSTEEGIKEVASDIKK